MTSTVRVTSEITNTHELIVRGFGVSPAGIDGVPYETAYALPGQVVSMFVHDRAVIVVSEGKAIEPAPKIIPEDDLPPPGQGRRLD